MTSLNQIVFLVFYNIIVYNNFVLSSYTYNNSSIEFKETRYQINCDSFIDFSIVVPVKERIKNGSKEDKFYLEPYITTCVKSKFIDPHILPLIPASKINAVAVNYTFSLQNLYNLENDGALILTGIIFLKWIDQTRIWNIMPELNGPKQISLTKEDIWHPIFEISRCLSNDCYIQPEPHTVLFLSKDGKAEYAVSKLIKINCDIQLENFPFDLQTCNIQFYIRDYKSNQIIIQKHTFFGEMTRFGNDEWNITSIENSPKNFTLSIVDQNNSSITYYFSLPGFEVKVSLQRFSQYYVLNLIVPVFIMSLVGFFTVALPSNSSEKINLAVTVLLGFLFLQTIISSLVPKSSSTPSISCYLLASLLLSALNVAANTFVFSLQRLPNSRPLPPLIILICINFLGILVCYNVKKNLRAILNFAKRSERTSIKNGIHGGARSTIRKNLISSFEHNVQKTSYVFEDFNITIKSKISNWQDLATVINRLFSCLYGFGSIIIVIVYIFPLNEAWSNSV